MNITGIGISLLQVGRSRLPCRWLDPRPAIQTLQSRVSSRSSAINRSCSATLLSNCTTSAFSASSDRFFVPASPAPMSGAVYVFAPDKVTYLNVPLLPFLKVISSWGLGLREIIEAQAASQGLQADHERLEPAASAAVSHP